jgi:hypothetical protein
MTQQAQRQASFNRGVESLRTPREPFQWHIRICGQDGPYNWRRGLFAFVHNWLNR